MNNAIDAAPQTLIKPVKNAFRGKLMKNMILLQSETMRSKDPELQQLYTTAYPADLIVAILMEVAGPCSNERMQDVIGFLNFQYQ